jgi:DNA replication and repair protein RecF
MGGLKHTLEVSTNGQKTMPLREGKVRQNRDYFGALSVISFTPQDLDLVRGVPEGRRRFLDRAIFNEQSAHLHAVLRYQRALSRRNAYLRDRASIQLLRAYEATLAEAGARLIMSRASYVHSLASTYSNILHDICGFSGSLSYKLGISVSDPLASTPQSIQQQLMSYWDQHRESDLHRGFTQRGPHNDDLVLRIQDRSARSFASQGQQRAIVLALKIAQIESLSERLQSRPILLLDDVSSELDRGRAALLFDFLKRFDGQVLLTTTHEDYIPLRDDRALWNITAGQVMPISLYGDG